MLGSEVLPIQWLFDIDLSKTATFPVRNRPETAPRTAKPVQTHRKSRRFVRKTPVLHVILAFPEVLRTEIGVAARLVHHPALWLGGDPAPEAGVLIQDPDLTKIDRKRSKTIQKPWKTPSKRSSKCVTQEVFLDSKGLDVGRLEVQTPRRPVPPRSKGTNLYRRRRAACWEGRARAAEGPHDPSAWATPARAAPAAGARPLARAAYGPRRRGRSRRAESCWAPARACHAG